MEEFKNKSKELLGIQMTEEEFDNLICEQAKGKQLKVIDGQVVAVEYVPTREEITETYEDKIVNLIRQKYTINQELAILRQRDTKPEEYQEYFDYVEQCKVEVKQMLSTTVS